MSQIDDFRKFVKATQEKEALFLRNIMMERKRLIAIMDKYPDIAVDLQTYIDSSGEMYYFDLDCRPMVLRGLAGGENMKQQMRAVLDVFDLAVARILGAPPI